MDTNMSKNLNDAVTKNIIEVQIQIDMIFVTLFLI